MSHADYLQVNRANWDARAALHADSPDYHLDAYVADPQLISDVVAFDRPRLGDLHGLRGVHLQCHIGTDTLSLARLGAAMTGLDLSPESLRVARDLAQRAKADVEFVEAEVYDAPARLGTGTFDLVYTGIGALCWLPDIARWARTVCALLAPGGRLFMREGHPMLLAIDETSDQLTVGFPYFEMVEPMVFDSDETYVETDGKVAATTTYEWSHGLGEVVQAVLDAGMVLTALLEHRTVPWPALPGKMRRAGAEFEMAEHGERLPLTYTLQAVKRP